jgi:hypothetical protein
MKDECANVLKDERSVRHARMAAVKSARLVSIAMVDDGVTDVCASDESGNVWTEP